jgi:cytidylate kinase
MPAIRLQRVIADAGIASRRGAEALIQAGRVRVEGRLAEIGERVDPDRQRVEVDGRALRKAQPHVYLALSKPAGVTSTVRDSHARRTVLDLVPASLSKGARLYPVGRLDRDSEGLLILTNDGALTERLLHPRHGVEREYAVALEVPLDADQATALRRGVDLADGRATLLGLRGPSAADVAALDALVWPPPQPDLIWYRVVLGGGRKRQIRRMFAAVEANVARLVRVRVGQLTLEGLPPGGVRSLTSDEVDALRGAGTNPAAGSRPLVVALDGPGSSGKSTVGSAAAARLGYRFCDTGLLYRAVTWLALERDVPMDHGDALAALVPEVELADEGGGRLSRVLVADQDVADRVASAEVDRHVSEVARQPAVRAALLPRQREIAAAGRILMAGRDIGTVVLPDADLKLFLDASPEERARRRAEQRGLDEASSTASQILADLRRRDEIDTTRDVAPLRRAPDAVVIRSDGNTLEQTVQAVVAAIRRREEELSGSGESR